MEGDKFYGAKATINVWEPKIQQSNEFSLSQLWILGGSFGQDLNSIEAGWQVLYELIDLKKLIHSYFFPPIVGSHNWLPMTTGQPRPVWR